MHLYTIGHLSANVSKVTLVYWIYRGKYIKEEHDQNRAFCLPVRCYNFGRWNIAVSDKLLKYNWYGSH